MDGSAKDGDHKLDGKIEITNAYGTLDVYTLDVGIHKAGDYTFIQNCNNQEICNLHNGENLDIKFTIAITDGMCNASTELDHAT